jgi:hypothetical protein
VFGRWIVDTAHAMHRAEVHPPVLTAVASVTAPDTTKAYFTSRPFLVSELYTPDQGSIYKDSGGNDGTFYQHLINEIVKLNTFRSTLIECHPKVMQKPMRGTHLMRVQVRPPALPPNPVTAVTALGKKVLAVSYHFTVRTGVAVQVISSAADTIDVIVVLNSNTYKAPPLPTNFGIRYSESELKAENKEVGKDYLAVEILSGAIHALTGDLIGAAAVEAFLSRGVEGDLYDLQKAQVNLLTTQGAVVNALATNIPANSGITVDDTQVYPLTGWVEAKWIPAPTVVEPVLTTIPVTPPPPPPPPKTTKPPVTTGKPPIKPF